MAGWPDAPPESDHASIDHVLAKAMGGMPTWGNEIAACRACNEGRGHLDARNFFDQVQRLGRDKAIAWAVDKRRRAMIKIRDQRAFERRDANRRKDIERLQSLSTPSALSAPSADE
jgi:CTP:molybdopterin cytidylyltransferase MocA